MKKSPPEKPWPPQRLTRAERQLDEDIETSPLPAKAWPAELTAVKAALAAAAQDRRASHGGSRPGAGRPRKEAVKTFLHLTPKARANLEALAEATGLDRSAGASRLLEEAKR